MKRKPTLYQIALWAALPMAHTSRIEGRLTMILERVRHSDLCNQPVKAVGRMIWPSWLALPTSAWELSRQTNSNCHSI